MIRVLVVDDEESVREGLAEWLRQEGWTVVTAPDAETAIRTLASDRYEIAFLDLRLPGMDGLELLRRMKRADPEMVLVLMTAYASVETAVRAMKGGAYDYIVKPFRPEDLAHLVRSAVKDRPLLAPPRPPAEILGSSPQIREAIELADSVARSRAPVVIYGESGTGKELLARRIHMESDRRLAPFVPVNCGGMPEGLLESELFGHERGAFTGAQARRKGKIELADGGTLFLDEIAEIPPKMQVDLLRVLETGEIIRLGGERSFPVDFRVLVATQRDLSELVREGKFREDLFFRLNVVSIRIPPLRDRVGDVPILVERFLAAAGQAAGRTSLRVSPEALATLCAHGWPGNVRELRNVIDRAAILSHGPEIRPEDLRLAAPGATAPNGRLDDVEREHILRVLEECGRNVTLAAGRLGIDRTTLQRRLKSYRGERETG